MDGPTSIGQLPVIAADDAAVDHQAHDVDAVVMQNAIVRAAFALLTPEQLAEVANNRMIIEQAKGMLMTIYSVSADRAAEMLVSRSRATNVELRILARHLTQEFPALSDERSPDRVAYDEVLRRLPAEPG